MALEVDTAELTGGYRIIDTDRHDGYQGVALVTQRDAHPRICDCEITHGEALARAKAMAAAPCLLADLILAAATLRRYEQSHRAKDTQESTAKAEVNAELAARFEATIARATA